MAIFKTYLAELLEEMFPELEFAQSAVEWAVVHGHVPIVMDRAKDTQRIMEHYDKIIECYRAHQQHNEALLWESYAPILQAINEAGRMQPQENKT